MAKILVVEDQPANVEILTRMLARKKHNVLVADTRDEAVATAAAEQPDLILMDIGIPNAAGEEVNDDGGMEAARSIKAAAAKPIPIIALTASAMMDEKKRFLDAGCDAVQTKPFEFAALLETIEQHLAAGKNP